MQRAVAVLLVFLCTSWGFASVDAHFRVVQRLAPYNGRVSVLSQFPSDYEYRVVGYMSDCSSWSDYDDFVEEYTKESRRHGANCFVITRQGRHESGYQMQDQGLGRYKVEKTYGPYCMQATAIRTLEKRFQPAENLPSWRNYEQIAYTFGTKGEHKKAIEFYTKAIEENPGVGNCWYNRGVSHLHLGDTTAALSDMRAAAALGEPHAKEYLVASETLLRQGAYRERLDEAERWVRAHEGRSSRKLPILLIESCDSFDVELDDLLPRFPVE